MKTTVPDKPEVMSFKTQKLWEKWLAANHSKEDGIWLQLFKKASGVVSVNYDEALDVALCYGWIDGLVNRYDEQSYIQKFTPRRPRSIWSKRNIEHVERLTKEGRIKPPGLKAIEAARSDGRWERAYDSAKKMQVPDDFLKELSKNKKAKAFFETLNKANKYAIGWRLQTAVKPETRTKRISAILEMLKNGQKFH